VKTNRELQRDVLDELEYGPTVDAGEIGVSAQDGIVALSGNVKSFAEKWSAVRATERVEGVRAVVDEMRIQLLPLY